MAKWFVWNPKGNVPKFLHSSEHAARVEAERLARQAPGETFMVLMSVAECTKVDVSWKDHDGKDFDEEQIPF